MYTDPTVSVLVPTYNRSEFLKLAIESILRQDYDDYEIVITDNCSTDNTAEVVNGFKDNRIKYYRNLVNVGATRNYNRALQMATGKYIAIFSDDDVMLPGNLAAKVRVLDQNITVGLVQSNTREIDAQGNVINGKHSQGWNSRIWSELTGNPFMSGKRAHEILYNEWNFVSMPTVMTRKNLLDNNKIEFNNQLTYIPDWDMWMKLSQHGDFYFIEEPLIQIRTHGNNESSLSTGQILFQERVISKLCQLQPNELAGDFDEALSQILTSVHTQRLFLADTLPTRLDLLRVRVKRMTPSNFKQFIKQVIKLK